MLLLQKLDDVDASSSEGSTVDLRYFGHARDGEGSLEVEPDQSTDPEACFTAGDVFHLIFRMSYMG